MNSLSRIGFVLVVISVLAPYLVSFLLQLNALMMVAVVFATISQPVGLAGIIFLIIGWIFKKFKKNN
ncbi:MAG: hypothetical protein WCP24_02740 [bacterium]